MVIFDVSSAFKWLKYCRYSVKPNKIDQSINQSINLRTHDTDTHTYCLTFSSGAVTTWLGTPNFPNRLRPRVVLKPDVMYTIYLKSAFSIQYNMINIACTRGNLGNCHHSKTTVNLGFASRGDNFASVNSGFRGVIISNATSS